MNKQDHDHPDPIAKQHIPKTVQTGAQEVRHTDQELAAAQGKYGVPQAIADHLSEIHLSAGRVGGVECSFARC